MKTIKMAAVLMCLCFFATSSVFSQWAECTPDPEVSDPEGVGVRSPVTLPVGFVGEYYNTVLTIISPLKASTWGNFSVTMVWIQLTEMINMPVGLTWETNTGNPDDYMYAGEKYCMIVEGIPDDVPGIRKIDVYANARVRLLFEFMAPGNPQNGGNVTYTLCHSLNLELGNDTTITTAGQFQLSANQNNDIHSYLWHDESTSPEFTVRGVDLGVGVHKLFVRVTDTVGTTGIYSDREPRCFKSDTITVTVINSNSIYSPVSEQLSVSPNPCNEQITVIQNNHVPYKRFAIYNLEGKCLIESELSNKEEVIDVSVLKPGMYLAKAYGRNCIRTIKLIRNP